jgi:uncharacterized membrane protein
MGFKKESLTLIIILQIRKITAGVVSAIEKPYIARGPRINRGGSCSIARKRIINAHKPTAGIPIAQIPIPPNKD